MQYESLYKLRYKVPQEYDAIYKARYSHHDTIHLDFKIKIGRASCRERV